ncbi:MAG: glycosyltransferase 87 family protein [Planctomycetota bacterium]
MFSRLSSLRKNPGVCAVIILFAALATSATAWRIYDNYSEPTAGEFDWYNRGLSDFHAIYFYSKAFADGVNPYSPETQGGEYLFSRSAPAYSPVVFLVRLPFLWLNLQTADVACFIYNLGLLGLLAWLGPRMAMAYFSPAANAQVDRKSAKKRTVVESLTVFFGLLTLVIISRPGHATLFTGYFTAELALGTIVALHYARTRPVISGFGMVFASGKPTFVLPLIMMMIFRKNFRALVCGLLFCTIAGMTGLIWLGSHSDGGIADVVQGLQAGQEALHDDPTERPVNLWSRTDIVGVTAKFVDAVPGDSVYLAAMPLILLLPAIAVWRIADTESNSGGTGLSAMIVCVSMLLAIYHHSYECLVLVTSWIGLAFYGQPKELTGRTRLIVSLLLAVPAANYASTLMVRIRLGFEQTDFIWMLITAINTVCLLAALGILLVVAFRTKPGNPDLNCESRIESRPTRKEKVSEKPVDALSG